MRYQIARDARPQVTTLLLATALSLGLWFIPYAEFLAYPFRIFVTFIHEGGHALAALVTGNAVRSLSVSADGSGLVYSTSGGLLSSMFVSSAGYLGAMSFGALLLWLVRRRVKARVVLAACGGLVLLLATLFGFLAPLWNWSLPGLFTLVAGVAIPAGLFAAAKYLKPGAAAFLVSFLAVQCVLNAVFDLRTVLFASAFSDAHTDAANMAEATGVPSVFWVLFWIVVAFVITTLALRAYVTSKDAPSQPDLPFEDTPLEV
ncbi:MAG TPA: M50 family metallopeptidase [Pyrinomonadaceae bacterium]|nr:M50 family metallopeptidase [Pyrinomonadaceae bacterium]